MKLQELFEATGGYGVLVRELVNNG